MRPNSIFALLLLAALFPCALSLQSDFVLSTISSGFKFIKQNIDAIIGFFNCPLKYWSEKVDIKMNFYFFYGSTEKESVIVPLSNATSLLADEHWKTQLPIVVFIPGFVMSPTSASYSMEVVKAYYKNGNFNLIVVDWYSISRVWFYDYPVALVPRVGKEVAGALQALLDAGAELHCLVGHSLGAHISGHIGRNLRKRPRFIASLDPAGPRFYWTKFKCQNGISATDAEYVVSVHTDWGGLGGNEFVGPVDFMPNNGRRLQPGCSFLNTDEHGPVCSHMRAVYLWCNAINNPGLIIGRRCLTWKEFKNKNCSSNPTLDLTARANSSEFGIYYMKTNGEEPYGQGANGT